MTEKKVYSIKENGEDFFYILALIAGNFWARSIYV